MQHRFFLAALLFATACVSGSRNNHSKNDLSTNHNLDGFIMNPDFAKPKPPPDFAGVVVDETVYVHEGKTLYTVDPTTFALTTVGDFGLTSTDPKDQMTDLAVLPDGRIYTVSRVDLYEVNPKTGKATLLMANISQDGNGSNVALTTLPDGTLLASDQAGEVRVIDPVAQKVTVLGNYGSGFDTAGDLVSVADGTMYGISAKGPGTTTDANALIIVDTTTAKGTLVGTIEESDGTGHTGVFGIAYSQGRVLAFTKDGNIIEINPSTGAAKLVKSYPDKKFYGAGSNPLVSPVG